MLRQSLSLLLAASLTASACASTARTRIAQAPMTDSTMKTRMADYVAQLPVGSRVRVERRAGGTIHGTLIGATPDRLVVQRATRIPEAPVDVPLETVTRIQIEERTGIGKGIIIGAAIGAAATFGFLLLIVAALE
jgi:hypothetical protein